MVKGGVPDAIDVAGAQQTLLRMLEEIRDTPDDAWDLAALLRRYPQAEGTYAKSQLLAAYRQLTELSLFERSTRVERRLTGRPVRTLSGVAPVAVLTEQHACPGECLFCPSPWLRHSQQFVAILVFHAKVLCVFNLDRGRVKRL